MKKFAVKIYLSTFYEIELLANSEADAIEKARKLSANKQFEILANLENWEEADEVTEISNSAINS